MMVKVRVAAGDLAKAMKLAAQVVEKRNTIPILSNVLIVAEGDRLTLTATDLDIQFRQDIPAAAEGKLAVTVPAHRLAAIASTLAADAQMTLTLGEAGRVTITSARSRLVLATLPAEDFPVLVPVKPEGELRMPAAALAGAVARVLPFRSTEEARYYLNGPLLHPEDGRLALVAVDGHRLMRDVLDVAWPEGAPEVILAPKACRLLALLGEEKGDIHLVWTGARIEARVGCIHLVGKAIDGNFPDYRRVIGIAVDEPMRFDPEDFRAALTRLLVAADERDHLVKIEPADDFVRLSIKSKDTLADAVEELVCEVGQMPETAFNARYLQEIVGALGGDAVEFHMVDAKAPMRVIRAVPDGAIATVMPKMFLGERDV